MKEQMQRTERQQIEHLADIDSINRMVIELSTSEMERVFIDFCKATFFIEDLMNFINFHNHYNDYEHFVECFNRHNFYEVALYEMLKKNSGEL
jgi:hypothetical protein